LLLLGEIGNEEDEEEDVDDGSEVTSALVTWPLLPDPGF